MEPKHKITEDKDEGDRDQKTKQKNEPKNWQSSTWQSRKRQGAEPLAWATKSKEKDTWHLVTRAPHHRHQIWSVWKGSLNHKQLVRTKDDKGPPETQGSNQHLPKNAKTSDPTHSPGWTSHTQTPVPRVGYKRIKTPSTGHNQWRTLLKKCPVARHAAPSAKTGLRTSLNPSRCYRQTPPSPRVLKFFFSYIYIFYILYKVHYICHSTSFFNFIDVNIFLYMKYLKKN